MSRVNNKINNQIKKEEIINQHIPIIKLFTLKKVFTLLQFKKCYEGQRSRFEDHVSRLYRDFEQDIKNDNLRELAPIHIVFTADESDVESINYEFNDEFNTNYTDIWLIDGQHRLQAFKKLVKDKLLNPDTKKIMCFLHLVKDENEKNELFEKINTSHPYTKMRINKREKLRKLTECIQKKFVSHVFSSDDKKVQRPKIKTPKWEAQGSKFINIYKDLDDEELFEKFMEINVMLYNDFKKKNAEGTQGFSTRSLTICNNLRGFAIGFNDHWYKYGNEDANSEDCEEDGEEDGEDEDVEDEKHYDSGSDNEPPRIMF